MSLFKKKYRVESAHLPEYDYSESGSYYVTVCLQKRNNLLGAVKNQKIEQSDAGCIAAGFWKELPLVFKNIWLGDYVFMPDHMHGIINILKKTDKSLHDMVGTFKSKSTIGINKLYKSPGVKIWQTGYRDRVIRGEFEYFFVSEYILNNPIVYGEKNAEKEWYELLETRQKVEKGHAPSQGGPLNQL